MSASEGSLAPEAGVVVPAGGGLFSTETRNIVVNGLWTQNPGIVQLLGLCPLLAISNTVVNSLSLGLATTLVMATASGSVALVRNYIPHEIRIPAFVLIIAALVTVVQLAMNAWVHPLYLVLGVFIPLITTNCIVLARVEAFASKQSTAHSILDATMMGLGLTAVLVVLGGMREALGKGTLFSGIDMVLGPAARDWVIPLAAHDYGGFLIAVLPPGAFIGLGLLIALRNVIQARSAP
jgi:Na+-translocating ferredoxin:NAD+ oxidoreductase subunit E